MREGGPEPYLLRRQLEPHAKRATSKSGEQIERLHNWIRRRLVAEHVEHAFESRPLASPRP